MDGFGPLRGIQTLLALLTPSVNRGTRTLCFCPFKYDWTPCASFFIRTAHTFILLLLVLIRSLVGPKARNTYSSLVLGCGVIIPTTYTKETLTFLIDKQFYNLLLCTYNMTTSLHIIWIISRIASLQRWNKDFAACNTCPSCIILTTECSHFPVSISQSEWMVARRGLGWWMVGGLSTELSTSCPPLLSSVAPQQARGCWRFAHL